MWSGWRKTEYRTKNLVDLRLKHESISSYPANIFLFKVHNKNTRKICEICLKLTIKTPEWRYWRCSGVFIVNFEHISHLFLMFLLLIRTSKCWLYLGTFHAVSMLLIMLHYWYLKRNNIQYNLSVSLPNLFLFLKEFSSRCLHFMKESLLLFELKVYFCYCFQWGWAESSSETICRFIKCTIALWRFAISRHFYLESSNDHRKWN